MIGSDVKFAIPNSSTEYVSKNNIPECFDANELTPFETDRFQELLQTARILNIRECISSYIPVFRWNQI